MGAEIALDLIRGGLRDADNRIGTGLGLPQAPLHDPGFGVGEILRMGEGPEIMDRHHVRFPRGDRIAQ